MLRKACPHVKKCVVLSWCFCRERCNRIIIRVSKSRNNRSSHSHNELRDDHASSKSSTTFEKWNICVYACVCTWVCMNIFRQQLSAQGLFLVFCSGLMNSKTYLVNQCWELKKRWPYWKASLNSYTISGLPVKTLFIKTIIMLFISLMINEAEHF